MKSKVSIIIAAYNIEYYIDRCIESVLNQSFRDLEIIVVNDGSTDTTLQHLNNWALKDNRLKIVSQDNMGLSEARKSGYKIASGDYILFMDGDDWLEKNAIEQLYYTIKLKKCDILLFNAYKSWDHKKELMKLNDFSYSDKCDYLELLFLGKILPCIWTKFVKKEFIDTLNNPLCSNISYAEDLVSVSYWFANQPNVCILDKPLYNYYQRKDSITNKMDKKVLQINTGLLDIKNNLCRLGIYRKYKKTFDYMVYNILIEYKVIRLDNSNPFREDLCRQFKQYRISYNNQYIQEKINKYSISLKVRIFLFMKSYTLGSHYDKLREFFLILRNI